MNSHEDGFNQLTSSGNQGMENLIICPKCQFVYDVRYLPETCRFEEEVGYKCLNCDTVL